MLRGRMCLYMRTYVHVCMRAVCMRAVHMHVLCTCAVCTKHHTRTIHQGDSLTVALAGWEVAEDNEGYILAALPPLLLPLLDDFNLLASSSDNLMALAISSSALP